MRSSAGVLAVLVCAMALAGCDRTGRGPAVSAAAQTNLSASAGPGAAIPLPGRTLLAAQPKPDCEFKAAEPGTDEFKSVEPKTVELKTAEPKTDDPRKLDYERQCYRHAEMIVRGRLQDLQRSVDKTIKAVKRGEERGS